jgi:hypothetical protein
MSLDELIAVRLQRHTSDRFSKLLIFEERAAVPRRPFT